MNHLHSMMSMLTSAGIEFDDHVCNDGGTLLVVQDKDTTAKTRFWFNHRGELRNVQSGAAQRKSNDPSE